MALKRLCFLVFLGVLVSSFPLLAKEEKAPIAVQLDMVSASPVITVHLRFTNVTTHDVYLAKSQACATGDAKNVFTVTADKQTVRYTGALERVRSQFPADYIQLAPKGSYDVTTVITQYAFLPGEHSYVFQYTTDMWDKTQKHRFTLTSNPVTSTFKSSASAI